MRAAVQDRARQPLVFREVPTPIIGRRDAPLRTEACGVCLSDPHLADRFFPPLGIDVFPIIPGHEAVGVGEEGGAGVPHFMRGDRAGACFVRTRGLRRDCLACPEPVCARLFGGAKPSGFTIDGGYAESMRVPAEYLPRLPDELESVAAAPHFRGGIAVHAVLGRAEVVALTSWREDLARELGADQVVTRNGDVGEQSLAIGGRRRHPKRDRRSGRRRPRHAWPAGPRIPGDHRDDDRPPRGHAVRARVRPAADHRHAARAAEAPGSRGPARPPPGHGDPSPRGGRHGSRPAAGGAHAAPIWTADRLASFTSSKRTEVPV